MVSLEQKEYLWKFKEQISEKVLPLFQCSKQKKEREFSMTSLVGINLKVSGVLHREMFDTNLLALTYC